MDTCSTYRPGRPTQRMGTAPPPVGCATAPKLRPLSWASLGSMFIYFIPYIIYVQYMCSLFLHERAIRCSQCHIQCIHNMCWGSYIGFFPQTAAAGMGVTRDNVLIITHHKLPSFFNASEQRSHGRIINNKHTTMLPPVVHF